MVDEQMDTFDFSKHDDFKVLCKVRNIVAMILVGMEVMYLDN